MDKFCVNLRARLFLFCSELSFPVNLLLLFNTTVQDILLKHSDKFCVCATKR